MGGHTFSDLYEHLLDWILRARRGGVTLSDLLDMPLWQVEQIMDSIRGNEQRVRDWVKNHPNGE